MIFVTGDCHGDVRRFMESTFSEQQRMTKKDYVIICGDFGLVWNYSGESEEEKNWLDWLENRNFTTLFVDGNHENFERLNKYPMEMWNGGKVHRIRQSVIHLMRGQVFEIAGKKIFTFGGARSHDISDGILELNDPALSEMIDALNEQRGLFRINHLNWWEEEMPSKKEMEEGYKNLSEHGWKVDYIVTHCCPGQIQHLVDAKLDEQNELTAYFDFIRGECNYEKWYLGHYHADKNLSAKEILLYHSIIRLGDRVDEDKPILGRPRYELYQPVRFLIEAGDVLEEQIGLVVVCDSYGTLGQRQEPSYDIFAKFPDALREQYSKEVCLVKHIPESKLIGLTEKEIKENADIIILLAKCWGISKKECIGGSDEKNK